MYVRIQYALGFINVSVRDSLDPAPDVLVRGGLCMYVQVCMYKYVIKDLDLGYA